MAFLDAIERVCFNPQVHPEVNRWLQQGVAHYSNGQAAEAEQCFAEAIRSGPDQLEAYQAQYKFLVTERRLDEALVTINTGLKMAAAQGGFAADWRVLDERSAGWNLAGAPRFFLYTLKAFAFVQMRREFAGEAREALDKLAELDPEDQVGGSVLVSLLERLEEDDVDA